MKKDKMITVNEWKKFTQSSEFSKAFDKWKINEGKGKVKRLSKVDYSEAFNNIEKWMPEFDEDLAKEMEEAENGGINDLADFFSRVADEDELCSYLDLDWKEMAKQYLKP